MVDEQKLAEQRAMDTFNASLDALLNDIIVCEAVWKNTKNPVYIWRAISLCFRIEAEHGRILQGITPSLPMGSAYRFPDWCMGYLSEAAFRINRLADSVIEGDITGKQAREKLPSDMGFAKATLNAFESARAHHELRLDDLSIASLRATMAEGDAMEAAAQEAGLSDQFPMQKRRKRFLEVFAGTPDAVSKRRQKRNNYLS